MQQRRFILPNPRGHHSHHRLEGDSKVSWGRDIFFNLSLTKALYKLVTASTSNDWWVRNHLSPFYVRGKGFKQVTDWPTATQLAGVNAEILTNPSGFKSCVVSPALPWMTYKLAGKRGQCGSWRLKKDTSWSQWESQNIASWPPR